MKNMYLEKLNAGIKRLSEKWYYKLIVLIPWVLFCLILAIDVIHNKKCYYETNDDMFLEYISGGVYGKYYSHNIFNHIILGSLFSSLYKFFPNINWISAIYLALLFLSFSVLGICLIERNRKIEGYLLSAVFVFSVAHPLIVKMNFSKTGMIVISAGLVCLLSTLDTPKWNNRLMKVLRVLSCVILVLGAMIRKSSFIALVPFMILSIVFIFQKYKGEKRTVPIVCVGILVALLWIANDLAYSCSTEWKSYTKYNAARNTLLDYGLPTYEEYKDQYTAIGISYTDYQMLYEWNNADQSVFGIETLSQIEQMREESKTPRALTATIGETIKEIINLAGSYSLIYVSIFLFLIAVNGGQYFIYKLIAIMLGIGELGYLIMQGRINDRAIIVSFIPALAMLVFLGGKSEDKGFIRRMPAIVCLLLIGIYAFYGCRFCEIKYVQPYSPLDESRFELLSSYTSAHSDNLYIIGTNANSECLFAGHGPLDTVKAGAFSNIMVGGGWMTLSPIMLNIVEGYGDVYNPYEILATNDKVYWISYADDDNSMVLNYIREHYNENAECTIVDSVGIYNISSFSIDSH